MKKLNRFEIVQAARGFAKDLKELPEDKLNSAAANFIKSVKETSAVIELANEFVKCIDTSRIEKIADAASKSFAVRKIFGNDGEGLKQVAAAIDATEQALDIYHKMYSAFAKDEELAKETIKCISRHMGNAVNTVCDIIERKDFDSPASVFTANDNFDDLIAKARASYKEEATNKVYLSDCSGKSFSILEEAYTWHEAHKIAEEIIEEIEKELKAD
jgi:BMFP domain-containing protein YqiC